MKKQFVTYEIALKLKELGFDEECCGAYMIRTNGDKAFSQIHFMKPNYSKWDVYAPLWQQIIDWFRETHRYFIYITHREGKYGWKIDSDISYEDFSDTIYNTYEEAREKAILKAIDLIK